MTEYEFNQIINDIISSLAMEKIIVPDNIIDELKERYVTNNEKVLIKKKGGFNNEYKSK